MVLNTTTNDPQICSPSLDHSHESRSLYPTAYLTFLLVSLMGLSNVMCPNLDSWWPPPNQVMHQFFACVNSNTILLVSQVIIICIILENCLSLTQHILLLNSPSKNNLSDNYLSTPLLLPPWSKLSCHLSPRLFD